LEHEAVGDNGYWASMKEKTFEVMWIPLAAGRRGTIIEIEIGRAGNSEPRLEDKVCSLCRISCFRKSRKHKEKEDNT